MSDEWVSFGKIAREQLGQQAQYASRYIEGVHGYPKLGEGLRFNGYYWDYHSVLIHRDDIEEFVTRVLTYRESQAQII